MILRTVFWSLLALGSAAAQQTLRVDPEGGSDFATIQSAVDAANPGDTILIPSGSWLGASPIVVNQGIHMRAQGTVKLGPLLVTGIPADQSFTASGFTLRKGATRDILLKVDSCQGTVDFDRMTGSSEFTPPAMIAVLIIDCAAVSFKSCDFTGGRMGIDIRGSTVILASCRFKGNDADVPDTPLAASKGMSTSHSQVIVSDCVFIGGAGNPSGFGHGAAAVGLFLSNLRAAESTFLPGPSPGFFPKAQPFSGIGTVVLSRGTDLCASPPLRVACNEVFLPLVTSDSLTRGKPLSLTLDAPAGSIACLLISRPMPAQPTPFGDLWFDLARIRPAFIDVVPASGRIEKCIDNVPLSLQTSDRFMVQAGVFDGVEVGLSPPVPLIVN